MTKDEALKMAIDYLGGSYEAHKVRKACQEALEQPSVAELNDEYLHDTYVEGLSQPEQEPKCSNHPDAPHGFCRDASHSADRYVCECEFWEQPAQEPVAMYENGNVNWINVPLDMGKPIPLYTHPAPSWQGLSDDEIYRIYGEVQDNCVKDFPSELYAAWFKTTKEKNNG